MEERNFGPVRFIPGENKGRYPNCHSLYIEEAGILIDPGSDRDRLTRLKRDPGVKSIWLSHYHDDHLLYLDLFDNVPLLLSDLEAPPLANLELYLDWEGIDDIEDFREYWRSYLVDQVHFRPRTPTGILRHGDRIRLPGVTVEIIHTPGHTCGHLAFLFEEPGVLFLGDYDLSGFGPVCAEPRASYSECIKSIRHLRTIPAKTWITSHGTGVYTENPVRLWDSYLEAIVKREDRILDALTRPMTYEEIVDLGLIYGHPNRPRAFYILGERYMVLKHLEHLIEDSRVRKDEGKYLRI